MRPESSQRRLWVLVLLLGTLLFPHQLHATWVNGHIVEMRPDGFLLQLKLYRIVVHTDDTEILCKKRHLPVSDLQVNDVVTVEGRDRFDGGINAKKITVHRNWRVCGKSKEGHCGC